MHPRYVADALPVFAIADLPLSAASGIRRRGVAGPWRGLFAFDTRVATLGSLALFASGLVTDGADGAGGAARIRSQLHTRCRSADGGGLARSVINTAPPYEISARADLKAMMNAIGSDAVFDRPAVEMFLFDGLAQLKRMDLFPGSKSERGPKRGLRLALSRERQASPFRQLDMDDAAPRVCELGYYAGSSATLEVSVSGKRSTAELPAGVGQAFLLLATRKPSLGPGDGGRVSVRDRRRRRAGRGSPTRQGR